MITAVASKKPKRLDGDELEEKFDMIFASLHASSVTVDKLIFLFEYGGKYAPLEAAELAGEPLDW
jgi:hypothetical protein